MEMADLAQLIKARRSIRRWQDKNVPEELLVQAVELATWAPNAGNQQSWRFHIIMDRNVIKAIAGAMQNSIDQMASWAEAGAFRDEISRWQKTACFFRDAPAAIAISAGQYQSLADKILSLREKSDSQATVVRNWRSIVSSRIQTAASAAAYLCLILHQMGLGAVWMTGISQIKGEIEKILHVPAGWDVAAFLPVGYPAGGPVTSQRKPVSEVCQVVK